MRLRPIIDRHRGPHIIRSNRITNNDLDFYIWAEGLATFFFFFLHKYYFIHIWWLNVFLCQPGKTSAFFSVVVLVERWMSWQCKSKCLLNASDCVSACMSDRLRTFANRFTTCWNHFFYQLLQKASSEQLAAICSEISQLLFIYRQQFHLC